MSACYCAEGGAVASLQVDTNQERRGAALVSTSGTKRDAHKGRLYPEAGSQFIIIACYFSNSWMARMVISSSRSKRGKNPSSPSILRTM